MIHRKIAILVFIITGFIIVSAMVFYFFGYGVNLTRSYPYGIYKRIPIGDNSQLQKGQFVTFCPSDTHAVRVFKEKGYWVKGIGCDGHALLLKVIVGKPHDIVSVDYTGVWINGNYIKNSKIVSPSFIDKSLPYEITLKENQYWIMSDYNENSFDSRYFGVVQRKNIKSYAKAIFTL